MTMLRASSCINLCHRMAQFQTRPLASHFNLFMRRVFVFFGNLLAPLDFIGGEKAF